MLLSFSIGWKPSLTSSLDRVSCQSLGDCLSLYSARRRSAIASLAPLYPSRSSMYISFPLVSLLRKAIIVSICSISKSQMATRASIILQVYAFATLVQVQSKSVLYNYLYPFTTHRALYRAIVLSTFLFSLQTHFLYRTLMLSFSRVTHFYILFTSRDPISLSIAFFYNLDLYKLRVFL